MIRFPLVATMVVAVAVATMIGLGVWQLFIRAPQKDALVASYQAAQGQPAIAFPAEAGHSALFRKASGLCREVTGWRHVAGENRSGDIGYAFLASCRRSDDETPMVVDAGWSANPQTRPSWSGGPVSGVLAPDRQNGVRLVSSRGLGGLEASAAPSPAMIRNSHRSYAVQWFAFAFIATLIFVLSLKARGKAEPRR